MHRVFCSELPEAGGIVELDGREKEHLFKVFRARKGDVVQLLDGRGGIAEGEVVSSGTVMVSRKSRVPEPQEKLHLCCAMPKKQKLDALLKQAAELGVWSIRPLRCERSVAEGGSRERWQLHLIEACKQSGNPFLPQITAECGVAEMLDKLNEENIDVYYGSVTPCKGDRSGEINKEKAIFIGPEGGFTPAELSLIEQKGGKALNFGPYTLRLETAAVAGLAVLRTFCAALCAGAVLLTAGCGCGDNEEYMELSSLEEANNTAYQLAVEDYESFEGLHGIRSMAEIAEEDFDVELDELDFDTAMYIDIETTYFEERESCLNYYAEEISEEEYREYMED